MFSLVANLYIDLKIPPFHTFKSIIVLPLTLMTCNARNGFLACLSTYTVTQ